MRLQSFAFHRFSTLLYSAVLTLGIMTQAHASNSVIASKTAFQLPPAAELQYSIKAKQSGISLGGSASVKWMVSNHNYQILTETRAMLFGKILDASSVGNIDDFGLAPEKFVEKRFGKPATTTGFNRDSKTISFTASAETYVIKGGEQDRTSATWQLVAQARAAGEKFKPGSEWKMFVAGRRDAEEWTFKVVASEKITTAMGEINTVHISKAPPPDSKDQTLDIWLSPEMEWYPVRLKFSDANGEYIDQTLESVTKL
ncbi:DUF3108 domain-containing protein [Undibacterium jejuense]|uniref:DUF3108 domain-containing protein n=1 Tax=Undibacterium jejuense TaxID=1344949 RepID=A0A923KQ63_9BURK|nr:DUF3108 domain-containing protein [Undibacterium jejuense]